MLHASDGLSNIFRKGRIHLAPFFQGSWLLPAAALAAPRGSGVLCHLLN